MPRTNNHDLPQSDNRGRIRPYVGMLANGRKARFQVGDNKTSKIEAERRLNLIRTLYEKQCSTSGVAYWREWVRQVAVKIGMGQAVVDTCIGYEENPRHLAGVVSQLKTWGIPVVITAPEAYQAGLEFHRGQIADVVAKLVADELAKQRNNRGAVADEATLPVDPLAMSETATLHQTLDAYTLHLRDTGKRDANGKLSTWTQKQLDRLRYLKEHHEDLPLWRLDLPAIQGMVAYWRNRPETKKGNRCSKDHVRDMLKGLSAFLTWLDSNPRYRWIKPRGTDNIDRSPHDLPQDQNGEAFQTTHKETYTPEQLATIAGHTDDFGRALIGVCVNCAFGASEIGQMKTTGFLLDSPH